MCPPYVGFSSSLSPSSFSAVRVSWTSCSETPPVGTTSTTTRSFRPFCEKRENTLL